MGLSVWRETSKKLTVYRVCYTPIETLKQGLGVWVCSENMIDPQYIRLDYLEQDDFFLNVNFDVLFCLYEEICTKNLKFANVACHVRNHFELRKSGIGQQISIA